MTMTTRTTTEIAGAHGEASAHVSSHDHKCAGLVPLFAELPQTDQDFIDGQLQHRVFEKGEQVFMPGDELKLIIVARGSLKVYQMSRNGREQLLRVQEPGGYEGEAWLLGQPNDSLYGQALETTEVCLLSHSAFHSVLLSQPKLSVRLLELNAAKITSLEQINGFLGMDRVEERLATYLLDLAKATDSLTFTLPIRMKELAHLLGTTPETLSRKLALFEKDGLIARSRRTIKILDQDALEDV
jgi:CRP/FNR family transcriptional regulator